MSYPEDFEWQAPTPEQVDHIKQTREALKVAAGRLMFEVPDGPSKTTAYRKLQEAMMWANQAVVFNGGSAP